ncbi:MAG: PTS glucose transporter subunit IIA [Thomasclavelia ramosa]
MGDGFAIELTDSDVLAPVSGEIVMTFPTKHAYGLRGNNGVEILIHLGMDTVQLEGKGFESFVKVGEYIKQEIN